MEEIFVPASGMAMEEALLAEWLKNPGDRVAPGEAIAVVETDKASVELSAKGAGVLGRHLYTAGSTVSGGATVVYVLADGEVEPATNRVGPTDDLGAAVAEAAVDAVRVGAGDDPSGAASGDRRSISPRQRRAARLAAAGAPPPFSGFTSQEPAPPEVAVSPRAAPARAATGDDSGFRQAIAAQVAESWRTIPHFAVGREVSARGLTSTLAVARRYNRNVTVTDFLLAAFGQALDRVGKSADVGLAVATEWGVVIPVVRECGATAFDELSARRAAAVERARGRRLTADDSLTPYASLSNLGTMGVDWFTGVVPLGQKALLAIGRIAERPAVEGRGIVVRPQFSATLTADHRELDGADSARLLGAFVDVIETLGEEAGA